MKRSLTSLFTLQLNSMNSFAKLTYTLAFLIGLSSLGCGGTQTPTVTSQDELTNYVEEHPESKELEMMP